ncbi:MAG: carbon storage regulator [Clostridia bacterium]|jgi:carbon storage regulator|nr:carbon storage regulator [Clostridia bacterium]MDD3971376.1 carbon storage regulator [Clostridia bacterium]
MLVISRKAGESIIIGDDIEVVIIEAQNGKVKIGVKADNSIRILRKEIIDEVTKTNIQASAKTDNASIDTIGSLISKEAKE